jgi:hypothetical protein
MRTCTRVRLGVLLIVVLALATACENESESGEAPEAARDAAISVDAASGKSSQVRSKVRSFMNRRLEGEGAEKYLDVDGRRVFRRGGTLSPLYPKPPLEDFKIAFVDDLGDGTYEIGVRLIFDRGSDGDTLFVHRARGEFVISGGRPGLQGP